MKLATMDACRYEIGQKAAEIVVARLTEALLLRAKYLS